MPKHEAARTLVKSPPELWEVCSDPASLSRHLEPFGEITITRLEPETTVAWEGERASGTVRIEPSGWGTRVTLTAAPVGGAEVTQPSPPDSLKVAPPPAAVTAPPPRPQPRRGLLARLFGRRGAVPPPPPPPQKAPVVARTAARPTPPPDPPEHVSGVDAEAALDAALDSLGAAHHRPFSRG